MITSKSLLLATDPSNSKISCEEEASDPPRPNKRPWNPGKNKISAPLPPFKVDDDGNDSDGRDSDGDSDGDGDAAATATNGDNVDDNNRGISSAAIGGKEAGAPCNTMQQPTKQEGRNERRRHDERGREGQEARKCDTTRRPNKWRGVKRGGGADWEAEGGHRATRQPISGCGGGSAFTVAVAIVVMRAVARVVGRAVAVVVAVAVMVAVVVAVMVAVVMAVAVAVGLLL
jgi:hypothetical protein